MAKAFGSLPYEINVEIALLLDSDRDLCTFRRICHETKNVVDGDKLSFWRRRFLTRYDKPRLSNKESKNALTANTRYKVAYQRRQKWLRNGAYFVLGTKGDERRCLEVLRELAIESFASTTACNGSSKNVHQITQFCASFNLSRSIFKPPPRRYRKDAKPDPLLLTIQLLLIHISVDVGDHMPRGLQNASCCYAFPTSQRFAYGSANDHPVFVGFNAQEINVEWVLHVANFFRYHLVTPAESTLYPFYELLDAMQKPKAWQRELKNGEVKLGKVWKGCYAFLNRPQMASVRAGKGENGNQIFMDQLNHEQGSDCFQNLKLEVVSEQSMPWPDIFEQHLQARTAPVNRAKTRAQHRADTGGPVGPPMGFSFAGDGNDMQEDFFASGWLNPLPSQQGIPGWQRMTMMKYYQDVDGYVDQDALWAYEGVVLPGGQVMLGRWWSPGEGTGEDQYSGPFIFWNVDGSIDDDSMVGDTQA
ncbi:hypothetical protein LTR28_005618 [Elasticomyces elasticus]|nr:hypothetical protein LTR28_005618 [Elasticomyces elasticus]